MERREALTTSSSSRGLTDRLRQDGRQQLENRKRVAADQIDELAHALGRAGEQLDQRQPTLAAYASQIASGVSNLATRLRDGSVEDLLDDTRRAARRHPGLFLLGGFAIGVALARCLKASERPLDAGEFSTETGTNFTDASAEQEEYPSRDYSPSLGARQQPYTPESGG